MLPLLQFLRFANAIANKEGETFDSEKAREFVISRWSWLSFVPTNLCVSTLSLSSSVLLSWLAVRDTLSCNRTIQGLASALLVHGVVILEDLVVDEEELVVLRKERCLVPS